MPKISNSKILPFSAQKTFGAVIDIESYPRILNFIQSIKILEKSLDAMTVRVAVGLSLLTFSYDCLITYKEPDFVKVELISGPFKKLHALWEFKAIDANTCKVEYSLDSKFNNSLMEITAGSIFASQINQSINAFEEVLKKS